MAVTARTLVLENRLRRDLAKITDDQTRDLVKAWAIAWDEVAPDLTDTLLEMLDAGEKVTRTQLLRSTRLRKALATIANHLQVLTKDAEIRVIGDLQDLINRAGSAQARIIASQLPSKQDLVELDAWSRVDERQLTAIVKRSTQQITSLSKPLSDEAYQAVRRELIRGAAAGSSPRETARRMVARAENGFNGGLSRALNIARTESIDAARAGALAGRELHADVVTGWSWHCELTTRSCPACISMDGTVFPADAPGPDGHQQCRCTAVPITKTWRELGFDIAEPPSIKVSADEWFGGLGAAEQKQILGPARYEAWQSGKFPMDKWATKQTNPGWRDSYVSAGPPKGGRAAA